MKYADHYNEMKKLEDFPEDTPHGWIQWKGTDVCIDLYCQCGHHGHFDGEFLYYFECPKCKTIYCVGQNVKLVPLDKANLDFVREDRPTMIQTCALEVD